MNNVTGLISIALLVLVAGSGGIEPNNGYCIGTQCFAVLQHPGDFANALNQCTELRGNLMTVRSSVAHDSLQILLENLSGRYWIGLRLPSACPDPAAELRGFQWVTKDTESDFYNWASTFDDSCASPKCVSVSKDSDFKWIQEPCDAQTDGFLCEYNFQSPCSRLRAAGGESVTYIIPYGFSGEDVASPPPGSIATFTPSGTKSICFSEQWHPAPWACEINEGGCEHQCAEDPRHGPSCFCPPGKTVNPANNVTCGTEGDDPCAPLKCQFTCYQRQDGSYACMCDQGFQLAGDGRSCVDFDECKEERQCPQENHKCVNTVGDFQCVCEDGYARRGDLCVDVDECVSGPCEHQCENSPGSYKCACFEGYIPIPERPERCKLHCGLAECVAECDPNDKYQCYCPDGYILDEREDSMVCMDMDECSMFGCDQACENTYGGFVCLCFLGYTLEEDKCVKDEEGSGEGTTPRMVSTHTLPPPVPTSRPSQLSPGALAAVILCVVVVVLVLVYLLSRVLLLHSSRRKPENPGEAHDLEEKQPHTHT